MRDLLASDRRGFFGRLGVGMVLAGATPVMMATIKDGKAEEPEPAPPISIPATVAKEEELPEDVTNREALRWALQYLERRVTVPMRAIPNRTSGYYINSGMKGVTCLSTYVGMEHGTSLEITVEVMKGLQTLAIMINDGERAVSIPLEMPHGHEYGGIESGPKLHLRMVKVYDITRNQMVAHFSVLLANEGIA